MSGSKKDDKSHWWRSREIKHPDYPAIKKMDDPVYISVADYLPEALRRGINMLGVETVRGFENPNPLLQVREVQALEKLVNSTEMIPVYEHLEEFELSEYEWPEVIAGVFAHAAGFCGDDKEDVQAMREAAERACTELAHQTHDLLETLSTEECAAASIYIEELQELLFNSGLSVLLAKLRNITTSEKWTELEYRRLADADEDWVDIEKLRYAENPDFYYGRKKGERCFTPPKFPAQKGYFESREKTIHTDFLREALTQLDEFSGEKGRSFQMAADKRVSKEAAIWLNSTHWQIITGLLLGYGKSESKDGNDSFSGANIRGVIGRHKSGSENWPVK